MATWDAAFCLAQFNLMAQRPVTDEIADPTKYLFLTIGQQELIADVAARAPNVLYGAPAALSTSDSKVFTFGTDADGYAQFPMGNVRIFPSLTAVPDQPWTEGTDYLAEGTQIRIPNNGTYAGTLYWRGIAAPKDIAAGGTNEPVVFPEAARSLIVNRAVKRYATAYGRPDLAGQSDSDYARELPRWLLVWRRQFQNGGVLGGLTSRALMFPHSQGTD